MWAKDVSLSCIFFSCPLPACASSPRRASTSEAPIAAAVWMALLAVTPAIHAVPFSKKDVTGSVTKVRECH